MTKFSRPDFDCMCKDSGNNTYYCVRTLTSEENSIYCKFEDKLEFVEMYDLEADPEELFNLANFMTIEERSAYDSKIENLKKCRGADNCKLACEV